MATSKARMTPETIKTSSGQFDLESVLSLSMPRLGLRAIEALQP